LPEPLEMEIYVSTFRFIIGWAAFLDCGKAVYPNRRNYVRFEQETSSDLPNLLSREKMPCVL
jgi:hypothetical protein